MKKSQYITGRFVCLFNHFHFCRINNGWGGLNTDKLLRRRIGEPSGNWSDSEMKVLFVICLKDKILC